MTLRRTAKRIRYSIHERGDCFALVKRIDDGRQSWSEPLGLYESQDDAAAVARGDAEEEGVEPRIEWAE